MGGIGVQELIIVLIIALVIFGPGKLPEVGKALGKSLNEFKGAMGGAKSTVDDAKKEAKDATTIDVTAGAVNDQKDKQADEK